MKLPELPVCRLPCGPGNQLQLTVMGEVLTEGLSDRGSTPLRSTIACFDEHLSIKVFKTRMYLICGFRNPFEAESEKWQNSCQLSIGGIIKWVKKVYGLEISKSSVCSVRDKCGASELKVGVAKTIPRLKTEKERAVLAAFKHFGMIE